MKTEAGDIIRLKDGSPRNVSDDAEITFKPRLTGHLYGMFINPQDAKKIDKVGQFRMVFDIPLSDNDKRSRAKNK